MTSSDNNMPGEVEQLVRLTGDDSDQFSFYSDGDESEAALTQHRYYSWGDGCVIAIGEINHRNTWDDKAFDAKCAALEKAIAALTQQESRNAE